MRRMLRSQRGFTLMDLLVVVAVLAVLTAIVAAAVTGVKSTGTDGQVKSTGTDGQVKSDAKASQTAIDNFGNKSIKTGQFPDVAVSDGSHTYVDVVDAGTAGTGDGANVILVRSDGLGETLVDKTIPSGKAPGDAVDVRRIIDFSATTDTWDDDGAVKTSGYVPDFLSKEPTSIILKGDETKDLGVTLNQFEEYIWLVLVNSSGTKEESRAVEVYRMSLADCDAGGIRENALITGRADNDPSALTAADITTLRGVAATCDASETVQALIYDQVF